jgi:hypothetical protein
VIYGGGLRQSKYRIAFVIWVTVVTAVGATVATIYTFRRIAPE